MDKITELKTQIDEVEKMYGKKKNKNTLYTFIFLGIGFYILGIWFGFMDSIIDYLAGIVISFIFAGIYFYVSMIVFLPIMICRSNEIETITRLKTELRLLEKDSNYM